MNDLMLDIANNLSARAENGANKIKINHLKEMALKHFGTDDLLSLNHRIIVYNVSIGFMQESMLIWFDRELMGSINSYTLSNKEVIDADYKVKMEISVRNEFTAIPPISEADYNKICKMINI